jgi:hypothetical protein
MWLEVAKYEIAVVNELTSVMTAWKISSNSSKVRLIEELFRLHTMQSKQFV